MKKKRVYLGGIRTLGDVKDRCKVDPDTDCWNWAGTFSTGGLGRTRFTPRAYFTKTRKVTSVLRIVVAIKDHDLNWARPHMHPGTVWRTCGNVECVNPAHLGYGTGEEYGAWMKSLKFKHSAATLAKITAKRRAASSILTQEVADAIAASDEPSKVLRDRYGLSYQHISKIRRGQIWSREVQAASVFSWRGAVNDEQKGAA